MLALLVAAAAAGTALAPGDGSTRAQVSGTSRPLDARHAHDTFLRNDYLYDTGYETCGALGLHRLAALVGVPASPVRVARAYADRFDPASRPGPAAGCLKALTEPSAVPADARGRN